jgi:outer membrane protein assembly factor BamB
MRVGSNSVSSTSERKLTRRAALAGAAGVVAGAALADTAPAWADRGSSALAQWPLPAHDLSARRAAPVAVGVVSERWRAHLPGGITGSPLLVGDRVLAASFGGDVAAFDAPSGRQLWLTSFGTATYGSGASSRQLGFFGGAAVRGGRVVVASDRARCLDARSGATVWEAAPLRPPGGDDYFWAQPAIAGPFVLLGSGSGTEANATRGRLSAYSLHDGTLLWSTPMVPSSGNGGGILGQPTVDLDARRVFVSTGGAYVPQSGSEPGTDSLVELALDDGSVVFSDQVHAGDQLGLDLNSSPLLLGRLVVVAGKDGFRAWDRFTHARLWHVQVTPATPAPGQPANPTSGPEGGPLASDGVRLYGLSNDSAAGTCVAVAIEPSSGTVLWQTSLPAFSFAAPAAALDAVAVPGSDGTLRLLSPADGTLQEEVPLSEPSSCAPSVGAGTVVAGTGAAPFLPGDSLIFLKR